MITMLMRRTRLTNNTLFDNIFSALLFTSTFLQNPKQEPNPSIEIF